MGDLCGCQFIDMGAIFVNSKIDFKTVKSRYLDAIRSARNPDCFNDDDLDAIKKYTACLDFTIKSLISGSDVEKGYAEKVYKEYLDF